MRAESTFVTRCSLVLRPIDAWTGRPASGADVQVALLESPGKPIRTSDGGYAFLDLPPARFTVVIRSPIHMEWDREVDLAQLPPASPVVIASLLPNRAHAVPAAATGIAFRVTDESGRSMAGVDVTAYVDDEGAVRGRLADPETPAGAASIRYVPGSVKLLDGDAVALRDRDGGEAEWHRVRLAEDDYALTLEEPLRRAYKRSAQLYPAAIARSDGQGYALLPFRSRLPQSCEVQAELRAGEERMAIRLRAEGGRMLELGAIVWRPEARTGKPAANKR